MQSIPAEVWRGYAGAFGDDVARMAQLCSSTNAGFREAAAAVGEVEHSCCICGANFSRSSREGCRPSRHTAPALKRTPFFDAREQKVLMLFTHPCCGKPLGQPGCAPYDQLHRSVVPGFEPLDPDMQPAVGPGEGSRSKEDETRRCCALERETLGQRRSRRR